MPKIIGFIPVRQGSERVRGKALRMLGKETLLARTIGILQNVESIDRVVVSTDGEQIGREAEKHGAEYLKRPSHLGQGHVMVWETVRHFANLETDFDYLVECHVTYPFNTSEIVADAIDLCIEKQADSCIAAVPVFDRIFREVDGKFVRLAADMKIQNSQEMDPLYSDCYGLANVYSRTSALNGFVYDGDLTVLPVHEKYAGLDIDDESDLDLARGLI